MPLLDLVNCLDSDDEVEPHKTELKRYNAVTNATAFYKKGEQLFENYGQPNYIYFMHHGFVLQENRYDCAPFNDLYITKSDLNSRTLDDIRSRLLLNGFSGSSLRPLFCLRDSSSLERIANFARIKLGIDGGDNSGLGKDVLPFLSHFFTKRLARYNAMKRRTMPCIEKELSDSSKMMLSLVRDEETFFKNALKTIT